MTQRCFFPTVTYSTPVSRIKTIRPITSPGKAASIVDHRIGKTSRCGKILEIADLMPEVYHVTAGGQGKSGGVR